MAGTGPGNASLCLFQLRQVEVTHLVGEGEPGLNYKQVMASLLSGCGLVTWIIHPLTLLSIALPRASQEAKFAGKGPETGKNARWA